MLGINPPPLTPESIMDFWKCPKLWQHKHLAGLVHACEPCEPTDSPQFSSQAAETIAAKQAAMDEFLREHPIRLQGPSFPVFSRRVGNGTSIEAASKQLENDMEIHLNTALWKQNKDALAVPNSVPVILTKLPTSRRRKDETGQQFQARCLAEMNADSASYMLVAFAPMSPDILAEAQDIIEMTETLIRDRVSLWMSGNSNALPGLRRGARCGSCEYKPLCWNGEIEQYRTQDGSPMGELEAA